jgi:hypothetical protein
MPKAKKPKLEVVLAEKQYRYAVARIPVHGENLEFCDKHCQLMHDGSCFLDPTSIVTLELFKKTEYKRHKICLESSNFVHMNIMRAKMEKMLGA